MPVATPISTPTPVVPPPISSQPSVSVVIPTYNHAQYLSQTLDSVLAQTYPISEIIVVNDGSPDDTDSAIAPYLHLPQLRYIKQTNHGQAHARNTGLAHATGELISFLDDDDTWPPEKTARQVELLHQHPSWIAVGGIYGEIIEGQYTEPRYFFSSVESDSQRVFVMCPFISPGAALIRREAVIQINGFDATIWGCDDWDLWIRLGQLGFIGTVNECALHYRNHPTNASRQHYRMLKAAILVAEKNHLLMNAANPSHARRQMLSGIFHWSGYATLSDLRSLKLPKRQTLAVWGGVMNKALSDRDLRHALLSATSNLLGLAFKWIGRTALNKLTRKSPGDKISVKEHL